MFTSNRYALRAERHLVLADEGALLIERTRESDSGRYSCVASNAATGERRASPYSTNLFVARTCTSSSLPVDSLAVALHIERSTSTYVYWYCI